METATSLRNHRYVGRIHLESVRHAKFIEILRFRRHHNSVIPQCNYVAAQAHGLLERYLENFNATPAADYYAVAIKPPNAKFDLFSRSCPREGEIDGTVIDRRGPAFRNCLAARIEANAVGTIGCKVTKS